MLTPKISTAIEQRFVTVRVPPQCTLTTSSGTPLPAKGALGTYRIYFRGPEDFPMRLSLKDPFGAHKAYDAISSESLKNQIIADAIVTTQAANPESIDAIPRLCPRVTIRDDVTSRRVVYAAGQDILNGRPQAQLLDQDAAFLPEQRQLAARFDGTNELTVTRVAISYDYEDNAILDYEGPHPITGKPGYKVFEGEGGFYANLHYAVMPYDERYKNLDRQTLLNLAEGKLADIDKTELRPKWRVHSFLPGPYLSKDALYPMCEWGDTSHQAPKQELSYEDLRIWDWDLDTEIQKTATAKIFIVVWEGDEEDWLIADGLLDPYTLTDDVIATFSIARHQTTQSLTLKNERGDFEMEVVTR